MAGSVNKVILIGRLGKDPEMRFTSSGKAVTNFSMATSESWKDAAGERQEKTEWHRVQIWGPLAEIAAKYLSKGKQVYIEGRLQSRSWDAEDGSKRYTTEIVANQMTLLGDKGEGAGTHEPPVYDRDGQRMPEDDGQPQGGFDDIPF